MGARLADPFVLTGGAAAACHHCGLPNPPGARWQARIGASMRTFCCAGCLALAQALEAGERTRDDAGATLPRSAPSECPSPARAADDAAALARASSDAVARASGLLRDAGDGRVEAALLLEGMTCGACAWLVERDLRALPGVAVADVNYAARRVRVVFDAARASLHAITAAVAAAGYRAHPYDPRQREAVARREWRGLLVRTAIAVLAMMQVMMFAFPVYLGDDVAPEQRRLLDWAAFTLTLPVMLYCAVPFFRGAARGLRARAPGMDVPVALALAAAFAASAWATLTGNGPTWYDSITMFVALLLVARLTELAVRQRCAAALEASAQALPQAAQRYRAWPQERACDVVPAAMLAAGDVVQVGPGAHVPADGTVLEGDTHVEEAWLTGEARPLRKVAGDEVLAGSLNRESVLAVRVHAAGNATRLAGLARLAERAALARPRVVRAADLAAGRFVTVLLGLALVVGLAWWWIDPSRALAVTFAVLVVSCPCALSLATPAVIAAAGAGLARRGILVLRADALETLARVDAVGFDKTGTLTTGRLALAAVVPQGGLSAVEALRIGAGLAQASEHPLSRALRATAGEAAPAADLRMVPGQGVEGRVDGRRWRLGRSSFVAALAPAASGGAAAIDASGAAIAPEASVVALRDARGRGALFAFADAPRAGAAAAVATLRSRGVASVLLSGDRPSAAVALARAVGIERVEAGLVPEDKEACVAALQAQGHRVAMVGDGVNDAPALARADVAISLASATPLAQCTADVVLQGEGLDALPAAMAHARKARRIMRQNLAWALAYNAVAIPAAALGFVTPLLASAGMSLSSLVVVLNAARALRAPA